MSTSSRPPAARPVVIAVTAPMALDLAVRALRDGDLVVLPTDTVYGLAAALSHPDAIARIYRVKRRPADRPIALLVDRFEDVEQVASRVSVSALKLMDAFWPGGLTLILPRRPEVSDLVTAFGPTVAVRMPDHAVPRAISRALGQPLPTTSANRSGKPSPVDASQALSELNGDVAVILDGGRSAGGVDSTVLDLTTMPPIVRRVGPIGLAELRAIVSEVVAG